MIIDQWNIGDVEDPMMLLEARIAEFWNSPIGHWVTDLGITTNMAEDIDYYHKVNVFQVTAQLDQMQLVEYCLRWPGRPGEWRFS